MHDTATLEKEELMGWRSLLKANASLVGALDRELEQSHSLGLPDYEVLTQLSHSPDGTLRMTELAREVLLSPSGLTRRLDGLVKAGLVERQPCATDGRGLNAVITSDGANKLDEMTPTYVNGVRSHFVTYLDRTQLQELISMLEPIATQDPAGPGKPITPTSMRTGSGTTDIAAEERATMTSYASTSY